MTEPAAVRPLIEDEVLVPVEVSEVIDVERAGVFAGQEAVLVLSPSVETVRGKQTKINNHYNTLYNGERRKYREENKLDKYYCGHLSR